MQTPRVALTTPIDPAGERILHEAGCEIVLAADVGADALRAVCADADAVIVRALLPPDLIDRSPRLLVAMRHGAGTDLIPVERATELGVCVGFVPGVNANTTAEFAIAQLMAAARNLHGIDHQMKAQGLAYARPLSDRAIEITGKTLGIVGVGAIGTRIAEIAHHGLRMRVLGFRREAAALPSFVAYAPLETMFAQADFIVLSCPLTTATRGLVSAALIARMKPSAWLLNVARGAVVDETALVAALAARRIGGAALDVFGTQPLAPDHALMSLPNVILSPHIAGLSVEATVLTSQSAAADTVAILRGERPRHLFNPQVWPRFLERRRALGWS